MSFPLLEMKDAILDNQKKLTDIICKKPEHFEEGNSKF